MKDKSRFEIIAFNGGTISVPRQPNASDCYWAGIIVKDEMSKLRMQDARISAIKKVHHQLNLCLEVARDLVNDVIAREYESQLKQQVLNN